MIISIAFGFGLGVLVTVLAHEFHIRRALKRPGVRVLTVTPFYGTNHTAGQIVNAQDHTFK